jgi:hypothetical protein
MFDHLGNHNDIIGYKMTYLVKIITKLIQDNQIGYVYDQVLLDSDPHCQSTIGHAFQSNSRL